MEHKKYAVNGIEILEVPGNRDEAIVLFHGFGSDAYDLLSLSQIGYGKDHPTWFFPQGPSKISFAYGHEGRAWFQIDIPLLQEALHQKNEALIARAFPDFEETRKAVDILLKELGFLPHQVFLGGFSQGAILAMEVALRACQRHAGLILLSGTIIHEESLKNLAREHAGMPFFQSHGEHDTILPYNRAQTLERFLINAGLKGKLHSFKGGHEVPPSIIKQLEKFLSILK